MHCHPSLASSVTASPMARELLSIDTSSTAASHGSISRYSNSNSMALISASGKSPTTASFSQRTSLRLTSRNPVVTLRSSDFFPRFYYNCIPASATIHSGAAKLPLSRVVVARLFGPAIFEASKLKVLFLGEGKDKHPEQAPRAYTLTHSDITAKLTLAVSQTINRAQIEGWYSRLQRDEVLAEWKKSQGSMSLHVHCHISGGHWLLDAIAHLRFYIFRKELPVVLEAFRHGDETLFKNHPELEEALVWVYFHSNKKEFNIVECWGPLRDAACKGAASEAIHKAMDEIHDEVKKDMDNAAAAAAAADRDGYGQTQFNQYQKINAKPPTRCPNPCDCCFPPWNLIPLPSFQDDPINQQLPMNGTEHT